MFDTKKFDLLVSVYIFCIVASELMGGKTFVIIDSGWLKLNSSVAIFLLPLIFTINDIITEVHGKERTRSIIRSSLVVIALIFMFSILSTNLPPSARFQSSEEAYDKIFGLSARVAASSLTAFAIAEFLDVIIFVKIREVFGKSRLWLRNNVSNFVSQLSDTVIFMFLAFYALDKTLPENISFLLSLIIPYWLLKCFMSIIETPLVYLGIRWLKSDDK